MTDEEHNQLVCEYVTNQIKKSFYLWEKHLEVKYTILSLLHKLQSEEKDAIIQ